MFRSMPRVQHATGLSAIALLGAVLVAGCSAYVGQGNDPAAEAVHVAKKSSALATGYWNLQGNSGTSTGNFLGTTDNQPVEFRVDGSRALLIDPTTVSPSSPNIVAGAATNQITAGVKGAAIAGGEHNTVSDWNGFVGGGYGNVAGDQDTNYTSADYATVGGGTDNSATSSQSTVGGGWANLAGGVSATVAGGDHNDASADLGTVGGGSYNNASANYATVTGGYDNFAAGQYSSVLGGYENDAGGLYSTILGGYINTAQGNYALAAGNRTSADRPGCFVWADSTRTTRTSCWLDNQWLTIATGGTFIYTDTGGSTGVYVPSGSGSWHSASSRTIKNNIQPIDTADVLSRVSNLPISSWSYKSQPGVTHIGPMAEDFYGQFKVGTDDKSIAVVDEEGVALASIQALNTQVKALQKENDSLKSRLAAIEARLGIKP